MVAMLNARATVSWRATTARRWVAVQFYLRTWRLIHRSVHWADNDNVLIATS